MIPSEAKSQISSISNAMSGCKKSAGTLTGVINAFRRGLDSAATEFAKLEPIVNDNSKYLVGHFHNEHFHEYCHPFNTHEEGYATLGCGNEYDNMPPANICRKNKNKPIVNPKDQVQPLIEYLSLEYALSKDYDGNSYIFGQDFVFEPTDRRVPFELRRLQKARKKLLLTLPKLMWNDYLATTWIQSPWHRRMCKGK